LQKDCQFATQRLARNSNYVHTPQYEAGSVYAACMLGARRRPLAFLRSSPLLHLYIRDLTSLHPSYVHPLRTPLSHSPLSTFSLPPTLPLHLPSALTSLRLRPTFDPSLLPKAPHSSFNMADIAPGMCSDLLFTPLPTPCPYIHVTSVRSVHDAPLPSSYCTASNSLDDRS